MSPPASFPLASEPEWVPSSRLIDSALAGDIDCLGEIYDRLVNRIYRYVLGRVPHVHDAEELTQTVFLRMLSNLRAYDAAVGTFSYWLMAIATREVDEFLQGAQ